MIDEPCPKCGSESLENTDDYIVCEYCGSAFAMELTYEGWFEDGGDDIRLDANPFFKSKDNHSK